MYAEMYISNDIKLNTFITDCNFSNKYKLSDVKKEMMPSIERQNILRVAKNVKTDFLLNYVSKPTK